MIQYYKDGREVSQDEYQAGTAKVMHQVARQLVQTNIATMPCPAHGEIPRLVDSSPETLTRGSFDIATCCPEHLERVEASLRLAASR